MLYHPHVHGSESHGCNKNERERMRKCERARERERVEGRGREKGKTEKNFLTQNNFFQQVTATTLLVTKSSLVQAKHII